MVDGQLVLLYVWSWHLGFLYLFAGYDENVLGWFWWLGVDLSFYSWLVGFKICVGLEGGCSFSDEVTTRHTYDDGRHSFITITGECLWWSRWAEAWCWQEWNEKRMMEQVAFMWNWPYSYLHHLRPPLIVPVKILPKVRPKYDNRWPNFAPQSFGAVVVETAHFPFLSIKWAHSHHLSPLKKTAGTHLLSAAQTRKTFLHAADMLCLLSGFQQTLLDKSLSGELTIVWMPMSLVDSCQQYITIQI